MSQDKKELLSALSIDRSAALSSSGGFGWGSALALLLLGTALGAAAGWWFTRDEAPVAVRVTRVEQLGGQVKSPGESVLDATGYVTARRQATVSSKITGKVVEVLIEEGMAVAEGQLLARLDDATARAAVDLAQAQLLETRANRIEVRVLRDEARRNLKRVEDLQKRQLASDQDRDASQAELDTAVARLGRLEQSVEVAERALAVQTQFLDDTEIRAPFAGVVIDKAAQPGEMISPVSAGGGFTRTGICTIVDMDSLEVEVDVNESYINRVSAGQRVTATLNSYPDWRIPAEVITIIPAADRNRATVRVRIGFLERDARVLPDMGAKVAFLEDASAVPAVAQPDIEPGLYLPSAAIWQRGNQAVVYVLAGGVAQARNVQVGQINGQRRRIIDGLGAGEQVVANPGPDMVARLEAGASIVVSQ